MNGRKPATREQELRAAIQSSGLPDGEVRLFIILIDKAQFVTAVMHPEFAPTIDKLMDWCGKSRAIVFRRLAHLERHHWVMPAGTPAPCPGKKTVNRRGPNARIVRKLCVGDRCVCPRHGGNRNLRVAKESHLETRNGVTPAVTDAVTPTIPETSSTLPAPERESHLGTLPASKESHLGTRESLILNRVSAGQSGNLSYEATMGGSGWGEWKDPLLTLDYPSSLGTWPVGSIGEYENRGIT